MADFGTVLLGLGLAVGAQAAGDETLACRRGVSQIETPSRGTDASKRETLDRCGTFTLDVENDAFANGGDRNFTQGLLLRWTSPEVLGPSPFGTIRDTLSALGGISEGTRRRASFGLGQNIYTPANIVEPGPIPQDRPYAGWLYSSFGATSQRALDHGFEELDGIEIDLGIVGPGAAAKFSQTQYHRAIGANLPRGWGNQIDNEPGIVLYRERHWRSPELVPGRDKDETRISDVTPHAGAALGNVFTYGAAGLTWRIGHNLPDDFGPSGIRPGLPGSSFWAPTDGFSTYFFAGAEQRVVLRNIFLDGGVIGDDPRVERKLWVHDLYAGGAVQVYAFRFTFAEVYRSPEFESQGKRHQFGTVSLSWRF